MAKYYIEYEQSMTSGMCGGHTFKAKGNIELTDEDVKILVNLIHKEKTTNVARLNLEGLHPDIYKKLDEAYHDIAFKAEERGWFEAGLIEGTWLTDPQKLIKYCEDNLEYEFCYDEADYTDENGNVDRDEIESDRLWDFREWVIEYTSSLDDEQFSDFMLNHMHAKMYLDQVVYHIEIPQAVIEMAK